MLFTLYSHLPMVHLLLHLWLHQYQHHLPNCLLGIVPSSFAEFAQKVLHPHHLATHLRECCVLRLGARQGHMWLQVTPLLDSSTTHTHGETTCRPAVAQVAS